MQKIFSVKEIQQYRDDTTGTKHRMHFNNAGAAFSPNVVVDTVVNYLREESVLGGYEAEAKYRDELEKVYASIATLIHADKEEIALVENASTAWMIAFHGIRFNEGDEIITGETEYVTNVIGFQYAEKEYGVKIIVVPTDEAGNFSLPAFEKAISAQTKLIAITHIASATGGILPVVEIGRIAKQHNILFLLDACQSVGQVPVDVREINCDMMAVTGRKYLRAPRGTGFLYVKNQIQDQLLVILADGSSMQSVSATVSVPKNTARRFELYEKNRGLSLGLGKAVDYAMAIGIDKIWARIKMLSKHFRDQLSLLEGVTVHDKGTHRCGIITFSIAGVDNYTVKNKLYEHGINVTVGSAGSTLYYMTKHHLPNVVRASVHYYNTAEEITACCLQLQQLFNLHTKSLY